MSKSSITCKSCGEENEYDAEFCISCGSSIAASKPGINRDNEVETEEEDWEQSYLNWKRSVPYTTAVCIFLIILDLMTGGGIEWALWPVIPIVLFAIIAPYFSYKIN